MHHAHVALFRKSRAVLLLALTVAAVLPSPASADGGPVVDSSGNGHHGTIVGSPTTIESPWGSAFGNAAYFDGTSGNYVSMGSDQDLYASGAFTLETRFRRDRAGVQEVLVSRAKSDSSQANNDFFIEVTASGQLQGQVLSASSTNAAITAGTVSLGMHTAALEYDGTTLRLYLDGGLVGSLTTTRRASASAGIPFILGDFDPSGTKHPFKGALDEVRLSNVARYTGSYTPGTTPFVADGSTVALYSFDSVPEAFTVIDSSGNAHHGALIGSPLPTYTQSPWSGFGSGVSFDGVDREDTSMAISAGNDPALYAAGSFSVEVKSSGLTWTASTWSRRKAPTPRTPTTITPWQSRLPASCKATSAESTTPASPSPRARRPSASASMKRR